VVTGLWPGFAERLRALYEAAGRPDLTALAARAGLRDRAGNPAGKRISDWMRPNGHLPHTWDRVHPVLRVLINQTAAAGGFTADNRELAHEERWKRWYDQAALPAQAGKGREPSAGWWAHSAYRQQVVRIAPPRLQGREQELAELAAFCTEPERGPYLRWLAPMWAGKSALMSWFVLHSPPGVHVVSFFVTARYHGQTDRVAFIENVLEQLAKLLDQPPAYSTDATRDVRLLSLLADAAHSCREYGRRLVLLVDGLDEDHGATVGPDVYSIAALLPADPPHGLRIIVAGRPNPPLPPDVPDDHPLRDPAIVRVLDPSPFAQVIRVNAERELKRLLHGSSAEQDLLGLVTAAGGGLSGPDLAELTGWPLWAIEEHLRAVSGRTFARRASNRQPVTGPDVYVLGHEELQRTATEFLGGDRLASYRQRLHAWANRYRKQGWPAQTPEYLLLGYYRMLYASGDLPRMVDCATDTVRHDRMLDLTGGDTAAQAEIIIAQDAILTQPDPDLLAMARLAIHRDDLTDRNIQIPTDLPAVWATLGHPNRAEALAWAITSPYPRVLAALARARAAAGDVDRAEALAGLIAVPDLQAEALAAVAEVVVAAGDHTRALALVDRAEALVRSLTSIGWWRLALVLTAVARVVAATGDLDRAETIVGSITYDPDDPNLQANGLAAVAEVAAAAGNHTRALALADQAEALAGSITSPDRQAEALAAVAEVVAAAGDLDRAEALARSITRSVVWDRRADALTAVARVVAATGDVDRAEALARSITVPDRQAMALAAVAEVVAADDHTRAEALTARVEALTVETETWVMGLRNDGHQVQALTLLARTLTALARAVAAAGDHVRAQTLAVRAEAVARSITDRNRQAKALTALVEVVVAAGDFVRAEALARAIAHPFPYPQARALTAVARAVAAAGDYVRAEALARSITDPRGRLEDLHLRAEALAAVVEVAAASGDHAQALALADRVEALTRSSAYHVLQAKALTSLARAVAAAGDFVRAEYLARSITPHENDQAEALTAVVEGMAASSGHARARRSSWRGSSRRLRRAGARKSTQQVEALARSITDRNLQAKALIAAAKAVAATGDVHRAETVARSIDDPRRQEEALAAVVEILAAAGDLDRAETITGSITNSHFQAVALTALAQAVAAAGDLNRAETITGSITDSYYQAVALTALAQAAAASDHVRAQTLAVRAEAVARSIIDAPTMLAEALTGLARVAAAAGDVARAEALVAQIEALARSYTEPHRQAMALTALARELNPAQARDLVAWAFRLGVWTTPLTALVSIQPSVLMAVADAMLGGPISVDSGPPDDQGESAGGAGSASAR
jgi:tetratricopeptide (TPR) repeat protein